MYLGIDFVGLKPELKPEVTKFGMWKKFVDTF